jgi:hypothetical protein
MPTETPTETPTGTKGHAYDCLVELIAYWDVQITRGEFILERDGKVVRYPRGDRNLAAAIFHAYGG